ncbi:ADP-ribosylglycohydrolase family protein [Ruegeria sp. HKCCD8929]|uniref:ADP-ribosylglycohydrolase family protein n=1 Tax=Ruegeria sp. HKCCD8929 TaxID=2683006 RepID=UPI0014891D3A|nr:ADP-ribosylglycohydrolase family protein [Ruegeria sp. HKCCD8929]
MGAASSKLDRAYGALIGMAIGDALGMPSQTMSPEQICRHYGQITGFVAPYPNHPVSHGLSAGQVTDDTEQALMLARRLVSGRGRIDEDLLAQDLLEWEAGVKARGLRDLLGPSSKAALDAMLAGSPVTETGRNGTTNGAAMRIAPIGIAVAAEPMSEFVDQVELACRMTHNTGEAIAAAAAVAAVISCGVEGGTFVGALPVALKAAEEGQSRGYPVGDGDIAVRISTAVSCAKEGAAADELAAKIGTSVASHESVAAAFGIVLLAAGDPWQAALIAANIGDDTDTIGAISCAMAGACSGAGAIPKEAIETIATANSLPLEETAWDLLSLRTGTDVPAHLGEAQA